MNKQAYTFIITILDIIGYQNDKNQFVNRFYQQCIADGIMSCISKLAEEQRNSLQANLQAESDPVKIQTSLLAYISQVEIDHAVAEQTEQLIFDFLETIIPTLSNTQKQSLTDYLGSKSSPTVT